MLGLVMGRSIYVIYTATPGNIHHLAKYICRLHVGDITSEVSGQTTLQKAVLDLCIVLLHSSAYEPIGTDTRIRVKEKHRPVCY